MLGAASNGVTYTLPRDVFCGKILPDLARSCHVRAIVSLGATCKRLQQDCSDLLDILNGRNPDAGRDYPKLRDFARLRIGLQCSESPFAAENAVSLIVLQTCRNGEKPCLVERLPSTSLQNLICHLGRESMASVLESELVGALLQLDPNADNSVSLASQVAAVHQQLQPQHQSPQFNDQAVRFLKGLDDDARLASLDALLTPIEILRLNDQELMSGIAGPWLENVGLPRLEHYREHAGADYAAGCNFALVSFMRDQFEWHGDEKTFVATVKEILSVLMSARVKTAMVNMVLRGNQYQDLPLRDFDFDWQDALGLSVRHVQGDGLAAVGDNNSTSNSSNSSNSRNSSIFSNTQALPVQAPDPQNPRTGQIATPRKKKKKSRQTCAPM